MDGVHTGIRRWLWPGLLGTALALGWSITLLGGKRGLIAWVLVTQLLSLVGLVGLLVAAAKLIRQRRAVTKPVLVGGALSLVALWPLLAPFGVLPIAYPASLERTTPAATVRLPSDSPLRVAWGGHQLRANHHAASPGQRWAYDLVIEPAGTGSKELTDHGCFDTPVVAPIDATVHQASDGEADIAIGATLADPSRLLGNHVILELAGGTYLVIAHLKQGSVLVKSGETVREGQPIGRCGNSGNTSEPHIHIHHQRQDPLSIAGDLNLGVNLVEGLPLYFRDHDGAAMPQGGITIEDGTLRLRGATVRHRGGPSGRAR